MSVAKKIVMMKFFSWRRSGINGLHQLGSFIFLTITFGCVDPYFPAVADEVESILVVEGFLNSTEKKAHVKLSRATTLYDDQPAAIEKNASVSVEEENGASYSLHTSENGLYEINDIPVDNTKKYRLYISTSDGKEYRSEYIQPKPAPSYDSLVFRPSPEGVTVSVNSHDPSGSTRYYQWSFTETWSYTAEYFSTIRFENGTIRIRRPDEIFYYCWKTRQSSQILVTTTTQLVEDRVSEFPVVFLPKGDQRISRAYSILVRQKTLDEKTYNYLKQLEKSTENLGGLFDPMPWQAEGNIHNTKDSNDPVLGYFNASTAEEKRLTFSIYDLPTYLFGPSDKICELGTILLRDLGKYGDSTPLVSYEGSPPTAVTFSSNGCIDCRILGGTTTKPDFMP